MADEVDPLTDLLSQLRCDSPKTPEPPAAPEEPNEPPAEPNEPAAVAPEEPNQPADAEPEGPKDILSSSYWSGTVAFQGIKKKITQVKYYRRMKAAKEVMELVHLESKPFGGVMENIIRELFGMDPRTSTQNDGVLHGKKIEIKSARYWAGKDDCRWQHLEPDHDYEIAVFALLDFHGIKLWCIQKTLLMGELREKKIVTYQGKQGWWICKSAIMPYLVPIQTVQDIADFISGAAPNAAVSA